MIAVKESDDKNNTLEICSGRKLYYLQQKLLNNWTSERAIKKCSIIHQIDINLYLKHQTPAIIFTYEITQRKLSQQTSNFICKDTKKGNFYFVLPSS